MHPYTGQALTYKIISQGYYRPTLKKDTISYAKSWHMCQIFTPTNKVAPKELTNIFSPWPFAKWGIDIIGPLPILQRKVKIALVSIDYFTKWAETKALSTIDQGYVIRFILRNIICRFGLPQDIVSNNGQAIR